MQSASPLGPYAAIVAAIVAVGIIAAYLIAAVLPGVDPEARNQLLPLATLAIGAVLGSSVAVNGYRAPVAAAHARLDRLQAAVEATATMPPGAKAAETVAAILTDGHPNDPMGAQAGGIEPPG